ncbi:MAG: hypothetical protein ACK4TF_05945 [Thermodesulfovibrionales bacterium]
MIIVSGFIEVNDREAIPSIIEALKERNLEVHDVKEQKIVFLMERDLDGMPGIEGRIRREIEGLKEIDGISNVYLAYFCYDEE